MPLGMPGLALAAAVVAALAAWAYGPGLPAREEELRAAYGQRRVVVCGASYGRGVAAAAGIGAEIAYGLARANASLLLAARSKDKLQGVARRCRELGAASVEVHSADLATKEGSRSLVEAAERTLGGVDVLVLNHVIGLYEDWSARIMRGHKDGTLNDDMGFVDKILSVNTLSYIYLSSYALPALARSAGRLIAVGSVAGKQGMPRTAPYAASKHAVFGYFDSLRQDLVASPDPTLRSISITAGVLGSFDTESARENTRGKLDDITWHPPEQAALALLKAGARRWRTVYVPWEQARLFTLFHPLMPSLLDWVVRWITLSGEHNA